MINVIQPNTINKGKERRELGTSRSCHSINFATRWKGKGYANWQQEMHLKNQHERRGNWKYFPRTKTSISLPFLFSGWWWRMEGMKWTWSHLHNQRIKKMENSRNINSSISLGNSKNTNLCILVKILSSLWPKYKQLPERWGSTTFVFIIKAEFQITGRFLRSQIVEKLKFKLLFFFFYLSHIFSATKQSNKPFQLNYKSSHIA